MKTRCLTALLIAMFFMNKSDGDKKSYAYQGYVMEDAGKVVVLNRPKGKGSICAVWEMEAKTEIIYAGKAMEQDSLASVGDRPMDIRMTVRTPSSSTHPSTSLGGGKIVQVELIPMDEHAVIDAACSTGKQIAAAVI